MPAQTVIKLRRSTAATWTSTNPTLAAGEEGLETDTGLKKVGNGSTAWNSLGYEPASWGAINGKPSTFTPSTHASTHASGGSDAITIAQSQVTNLTTDLAGKAATGHTHTFSTLTDFNISSPTNGQSITYDSASSKWINSAAAATGETISSFLLMGA